MHLPNQDDLPVNKLAASFNNTSAAYKFYWLLSIIQSVEHDVLKISKKDLFARMIANSWYTVNYFNISFGVQDKLQRAIENLRSIEQLTIDEDRENIYKALTKANDRSTLSHLKYFDKQVPHWFLTPWLKDRTKNQIYSASQSFSNQCLYALYHSEIVVNPAWVNYLKQNAGVLKDFCYWNLALYLQKRNPSVPDIPNKLIKPAKRNSLNDQRKNFWDIVLNELGSVECIYTGERLSVGNYAVEHFIPHAFVSHDLIWNLIPANASFNSSKSNKLPRFERYFDPFFSLQKQAIEIVKDKAPKSKHLLEYLTIFPDLEEVAALPEKFTRDKFRECLLPLITIASNNGFEFFNEPAKYIQPPNS